MKCEKCGKNPATTHYTQIINGEKKEMHLCEACAAGQSNTLFGELPNLFGSLFFGAPRAAESRAAESKACPRCGTTFEEIAECGELGCADCYAAFAGELTPYLGRLHGKTAHTGKVPKSAGGTIRLKSEIAEARGKLAKAVEEQEFEKAAELRDRIKELNERLGETK